MSPTAPSPQPVEAYRPIHLQKRPAYHNNLISLHVFEHCVPVEAAWSAAQCTCEAGVWKQRHGWSWAELGGKGCLDKDQRGHAQQICQQLQDRQSLLKPPLRIVPDRATMASHARFSDRVKRSDRLALDNLLTPAGLAALPRASNACMPSELRAGAGSGQAAATGMS